MGTARRIARELVIAIARRVLGRRYLFRVGEALSLATRLETENLPEKTGEREIVKTVVAAIPAATPLIVVDVGANVGAWTAAVVNQRGARQLHVYAFEPAPLIASRLEASVAPFGSRVSVVRAAAAESDGTTSFYFRPDNPLVSSVVDSGNQAAEAIQVRTVRLDTFAAEQQLERIHLLKIDAEGYDMEVLRGAAGLIERRAVEVVQFEYNASWIFSRHFLRDAFEFFESRGFSLGKVTPEGIEFYRRWQPVLETFHDANFIACTPDWTGRFRRVEPPWPE